MEVDIEKEIITIAASKVLEGITQEKKDELLELALTKSLERVLNSYQVGEAIKLDVMRYMSEYVATPDVQARVCEATHTAIDILMDNVTLSIVDGAREYLNQAYKKQVK